MFLLTGYCHCPISGCNSVRSQIAQNVTIYLKISQTAVVLPAPLDYLGERICPFYSQVFDSLLSVLFIK